MHSIQAVIGRPDVVEWFAATAGCPAPTILPLGFVIAPLGAQQFDRITDLQPGDYAEGFAYLSQRLQRTLLAASSVGPIVYLETNYFGGAGSQAAAAFIAGGVAIARATPVSRRAPSSEYPINAALRAISVASAEGCDEFDTLTLGEFRDLESLGIEEADD